MTRFNDMSSTVKRDNYMWLFIIVYHKGDLGRQKGNKLKRVHIILTPRAKVDDEELRNVISSDNWLSEYRFEQNTKYNDIVVMKIA